MLIENLKDRKKKKCYRHGHKAVTVTVKNLVIFLFLRFSVGACFPRFCAFVAQNSAYVC
jgi:hypothetical protein